MTAADFLAEDFAIGFDAATGVFPAFGAAALEVTANVVMEKNGTKKWDRLIFSDNKSAPFP
ncbi:MULTISPECIES: hypothetical protein [unclassified Pseudomonas]|uniref:hypothetical protein n=1 Tax=unclassified Pseudomonas TaxID=196821 RepID=UPI001304B2F4|nr:MULTISPECIES: hypothetical protein [unclassified Pseudomonas]